jgi:hypothetical protein
MYRLIVASRGVNESLERHYDGENFNAKAQGRKD